MPRFTRLTSQYVRRELLRLLRRKYLPLLARHIYRQPADALTWPALALPIEVEPLRACSSVPSGLGRDADCGAKRLGPAGRGR